MAVNVKAIKMLNGEEIVVNLISMSEGGFVVRDPLLLQPGRDPKDGTPILAFVAWSVIQDYDTDVTIPITSVAAFPMSVQPEVESSYITNTSPAGIVVPPKSQILHG